MKRILTVCDLRQKVSHPKEIHGQVDQTVIEEGDLTMDGMLKKRRAIIRKIRLLRIEFILKRSGPVTIEQILNILESQFNIFAKREAIHSDLTAIETVYPIEKTIRQDRQMQYEIDWYKIALDNGGEI